MKTRAFQVIDGLVGIAVFLLLAVAVIAGQAQFPQAAADGGVAPQSATARSPSAGDGQFSLLAETLHAMPGADGVSGRHWREDVVPDRHPGISE